MDNGADMEVIFKADVLEKEDEEDQETEVSAPPTPITHCDMNIIIRGWEAKFRKADRVSAGSADIFREGELRHVPGWPGSTCSEPRARSAPRGISAKI